MNLLIGNISEAFECQTLLKCAIVIKLFHLPVRSNCDDLRPYLVLMPLWEDIEQKTTVLYLI